MPQSPSSLSEGTFLAGAYAHYAIGSELAKGGQLFALHVPPKSVK